MNDNLKRQLLEVWKALEALTVSMDRIGAFTVKNGEQAGKDAIWEYMGPDMNERIAEARRTVITILQQLEPDIYDELEELSTNEDAIGYWQGRK